MIEDSDPAQRPTPGTDQEGHLLALSCRAVQARVRAIRALPVVTIAEIEEVAEILAAHRVEEIGRALGPFSAEAALAWERLQRIGYRRRSLFKAALPGK